MFLYLSRYRALRLLNTAPRLESVPVIQENCSVRSLQGKRKTAKQSVDGWPTRDILGMSSMTRRSLG